MMSLKKIENKKLFVWGIDMCTFHVARVGKGRLRSEKIEVRMPIGASPLESCQAFLELYICNLYVFQDHTQ